MKSAFFLLTLFGGSVFAGNLPALPAGAPDLYFKVKPDAYSDGTLPLEKVTIQMNRKPVLTLSSYTVTPAFSSPMLSPRVLNLSRTMSDGSE